MKKHLLSLILAIIILLNFSFSNLFIALAADIPEEYNEPISTFNSEEPEIIAKDPDELQKEIDDLTYEIQDLREENIKHIHLSDGTYQAVVYGVPVHRMNADGKWEEIDNTLAEKNGFISTSDSRIVFDNRISEGGHIYSVNDGQYKLSVSFNEATTNSKATIENNNYNQDEKTKLEKLTDVEKLSSVIVYPEILPGIDLKYTLMSNDIKEDIVINSLSDTYSYSFGIFVEGLSARYEKGTIVFSDKLSSEDVYYYPVPFMYDDSGEMSFDVFYSLEELGTGQYKLTVTADKEWINSDERKLPIIIDPSLTDIGQTDDTFVASATPSLNYGGIHELTVANNMEVYYKFATPHLPTGVSVQEATFKVPYYFTVNTSNYVTVDLYKITSNWYEDIVTWNSKPTVSGFLDSQDIYRNGATTNNPRYVEFSVDNYVQSWYTGTSNYGFAMKFGGGTGVSVSFVAKERMTIFAQLVIKYSGNKLPEGIYAIQKQGSNCFFESYRPDSLAWVLQDTTFTSPPLSTNNLENLFKIAYRPAYDDYVIRSMIDSSLVIYPSVSNGAPIAGFLTQSDLSMPTAYTWKIEFISNTSGYYITHTENGVKYYIRSNSTSNGYKLVLTTNPNETGTKWLFNSYTGNTYEDIKIEDFDATIYVGDTISYKSFMRSTRIGQNGPLSYTVTNADSGNTSTNKAEINSSTGILLAKEPGAIRIRITYSGAPWVWIWNVTIFILPVSGYEVSYLPDVWNSNDVISINNCYNYAVNYLCQTPLDSKRFLQPGDVSNNLCFDLIPTTNHNNLPCFYWQLCTADQLISYAESDAEEQEKVFISVNKNDVCPIGTYKIALVLDYTDDVNIPNFFDDQYINYYGFYIERPDIDYHWYRQNPDGTWSHKTGGEEVTNRDASDQIIYDPGLCNRDYTNSTGINYEIFLGYFAVSSW